MRKAVIMVGSIVLLMVLVYALIVLYVGARLDGVKENVAEKNSEVIKMKSISRIGQWGEMFNEFSLVVGMKDGQTYRIWTADDGEITDKVLLSK